MKMQLTNVTANEQFPLWSKTLGTIMTLLGTIGIAGNIMVILAVFRKNTSVKKNKCTMLLGSLAVMDSISCAHFFQNGISLLVGWCWMPQIYCFLSQMLYIVSLNASCFMILSVAIDRFLSLQFPIKYYNFNQKIYLSFMIGMAAGFGMINLIMGAMYTTSETTVPACGMPTALHGVSMVFWNVSNLILNVLVVGCYVASYTRVRISGVGIFSDAAQMKKEKHLLNSMLIVTSIYFMGWLVPVACGSVMSIALEVTPSVYIHVAFSFGFLACINFGCNFFVYYARSSEYRAEFLLLMGKKNALDTVRNSRIPGKNYTNGMRQLSKLRIGQADRDPNRANDWCSDI